MMNFRSRTRTSSSFHRPTIQLSTLDHKVAREGVVAHIAEAKEKSVAGIGSHAHKIGQQAYLSLLILVVTLFYPAGSYIVSAQEPTDTTPTTTETTQPEEAPAPAPAEETPAPAPAPVQEPEPAPAPAPAPEQKGPAPGSTGPQSPTGADGNKYVLNPETGLWESDKYTWDPVTKKTAPKTPQTYSYNPDTGRWDTTEYVYDPASNAYKPNVKSVATPPPEVAVPQPPATMADMGNDKSNYVFSGFYDAAISNNIQSQAVSGDAAVLHNTLGGNALTGDALTMANVINMLQSSSSFGGGGEIATFNSTINGDVFGDLMIDPNVLAAVQGAATLNQNKDLDVDVHIAADGQINNNITLDARSGDATVAGNTTGGNATTGNADAMANVVNMINSAIGSGRSFMGMLNITGNFDGDILLPPGFLDSVLAGNNTQQYAADTTINAELNDTQAINNAVNAAANSGSATVAGNTSAGNATTGKATTDVTVLNLTGRTVVAANSLLVFVNVGGQWVGAIIDAPAGTQSAMVGGGVSQNSTAVSADYAVDTNHQINNNIDVNAQTGDAAVERNTKAGNATSGDATAKVNIANIMNSSFSIADWFGVLFINIFGDWNGSFGVDTAFGETASQQAGGAATGAAAGMSDAAANPNVRVFQFRPSQQQGALGIDPVDMSDPATAQAVQTAVQSATDQKPDSSDQSAPEARVAKLSGSDWVIPAVGFALGGTLLGGERIASSRQRRKR